MKVIKESKIINDNEIDEKISVSVNTLNMMDAAIQNFNKNSVSDAIELSDIVNDIKTC